MSEWIEAHWIELLSALGIGGGSGILGKKLTDRKQNKDIEYLKSEVKDIRSELSINSDRDLALKEHIAEMKLDFKESLTEIKQGQKELQSLIIDLIKNK